MPEETVILVDNSDTPQGYASREESHTGDGKHHRAFALLLFDKNKRILLQKRKSKLWDGYWDITGASHPLHIDGKDESYEEAASRCAKNEWGVTANMEKVLAFNYFERFEKGCENEYCALVIGEVEGDVKPNPDYVYEHKWVTLTELVADIQENEKKYVPWAKIAIQDFLNIEKAQQFL